MKHTQKAPGTVRGTGKDLMERIQRKSIHVTAEKMRIGSLLGKGFLIGLFFIFTGCTSVNTMYQAQHEPGVVENFNASYEVVYDKALKVLEFQGAEILEADINKKIIIAKHGMGRSMGISLSYGELLGLYFFSPSDNVTRVKIVEKDRCKLPSVSNSWSIKTFGALREQIKHANES